MELKHTMPLTTDTNVGKLSYVQGIVLGLMMTAGDPTYKEMYERAYQYTIDLIPVAAKADREKEKELQG
jgi:hypothetical protein